jgi:hypothetical protein
VTEQEALASRQLQACRTRLAALTGAAQPPVSRCVSMRIRGVALARRAPSCQRCRQEQHARRSPVSRLLRSCLSVGFSTIARSCCGTMLWPGGLVGRSAVCGRAGAGTAEGVVCQACKPGSHAAVCAVQWWGATGAGSQHRSARASRQRWQRRHRGAAAAAGRCGAAPARNVRPRCVLIDMRWCRY